MFPQGRELQAETKNDIEFYCFHTVGDGSLLYSLSKDARHSTAVYGYSCPFIRSPLTPMRPIYRGGIVFQFTANRTQSHQAQNPEQQPADYQGLRYSRYGVRYTR